MKMIKLNLADVKQGQKIVYPETDSSLFKNGYIDGDSLICEYYGSVTTYTEYIPPTPPFVDITLSTTPRYKVGDTVNFAFTTNLPDGNYYMPYHLGSSDIRLKDVNVANGSGSISFTFNESGIYYIAKDEVEDAELKINGALSDDSNRFTVYVAE